MAVPTYRVYDAQGQKLEVQVNEIPQHVLKLPGGGLFYLSFVEYRNIVFKYFIHNVVSTNKRSQAELFTVYFSLKYLECNNYNVHYALTPLT